MNDKLLDVMHKGFTQDLFVTNYHRRNTKNRNQLTYRNEKQKK